MKVTILCVGKIKERFYTMAIQEYQKRLSKYCRLEIMEVADEKTKDGASASEEEEVKKREGERLQKLIKPGAYVTALAIEGERFSSEEWADYLEAKKINGISHFIFIIGGSLGLSTEVRKQADQMLSFSEMTFPHQLMRVILLEQIYRVFRIQNGEPYHK